MTTWKKLALAGDARLASACLEIFPEPSSLLVFVFHSLFASEEEVALDRMDPQQAVTTSMFRSFVSNFREHGYQFVSPDEIVAGLRAGGKYAMITFDDGYANNRRALPTLEEFQAPATFCISTNHVRTGKPFWWDVLYREARQRNWPEHRLEKARAAWKRMRTRDAEKQVVAEFGSAAFQTISDLDRPMTEGELRSFASHRLVHIGNHTSDHAVLVNYPPEEVRDQIREAQEALGEMTGRAPQVIAYPNGDASPLILAAVHDAGLRLGMTVQPGKNPIASTRPDPQPDLTTETLTTKTRIKTGSGTEPNTRALQLKRYTLWGERDIAGQCQVARSPWSLQAGIAVIKSGLIRTGRRTA